MAICIASLTGWASLHGANLQGPAWWPAVNMTFKIVIWVHCAIWTQQYVYSDHNGHSNTVYNDYNGHSNTLHGNHARHSSTVYSKRNYTYEHVRYTHFTTATPGPDWWSLSKGQKHETSCSEVFRLYVNLPSVHTISHEYWQKYSL